MVTTAEPQMEAIRQELPVLERMVYLNSGTAGPLPRRTVAAITAASERQLLDGRASFPVYFEEYFPLLADVRARFARLLGADTGEVAITHHTTEGMNIATWGLNWQPGDEIVLTTHEHEAGLLPAYAVARRFGLGVRLVDTGGAPDTVAGAVIAALSPRTRLVILSHVTFTTGAILPVQEIAAAAHRLGALVAVDGAQSVGAIPVDVHALDVDFYAVPGQKWLCGPEGVGALYVRQACLSALAPTFIGAFGLRDFEAMDLTGHFLPAPDARRYEQSSVYWPTLYGMRESLRWMEEDLGWPWVFAQTAAITARCRALLSELPGVTLHTPMPQGPLTAFSVAGHEAQATATYLGDQGIVIRPIPHYDWLRVATGFFTNDADLERLRDGLLTLPALGAEGPGAP
ncbi:MAG TPA: aminotransferase class V-fold PLP-dependent enzyme [Chloroflexia bacterium]|nr:aminotransferase class V-fold PLP-dependent enzyme [Chloroflexia bacterium]